MSFALGQIYMFGGNFAPRGWAFCDGQLLPINQNQALYSILGTMYGGDGRTTFALPDLRGRMPVGVGQSPGTSAITQGEKGGVENTSLTVQNLPNHTHVVSASLNVRNEPGDETSPGDGSIAVAPSQVYHADGPTADSKFASGSVTASSGFTGDGQSFTNRMPFQAVNYIICIQGLFPSRN